MRRISKLVSLVLAFLLVFTMSLNAVAAPLNGSVLFEGQQTDEGYQDEYLPQPMSVDFLTVHHELVFETAQAVSLPAPLPPGNFAPLRFPGIPRAGAGGPSWTPFSTVSGAGLPTGTQFRNEWVQPGTVFTVDFEIDPAGLTAAIVAYNLRLGAEDSGGQRFPSNNQAGGHFGGTLLEVDMVTGIGRIQGTHEGFMNHPSTRIAIDTMGANFTLMFTSAGGQVPTQVTRVSFGMWNLNERVPWLADTDASVAMDTIQTAGLGAITVPHDTQSAMVAAVIAQVRAQAEALVAAQDVTIGDIAFVNIPTVPPLGLPASMRNFEIAIAGDDGSAAVARVSTSVTFDPPLSNNAVDAALYLRDRAFAPVFVAWDDNATAMVNDALAQATAQIVAAAPSNVTITGVAFVSPPTITNVGIPQTNFVFNLLVTGDDSSSISGTATVPVQFAGFGGLGATPLARYHEFRITNSQWANNPQVLGAGNFNTARHAVVGSQWYPASTMDDGRQLRPEWLAPGVVITLEYTILENTVPFITPHPNQMLGYEIALSVYMPRTFQHFVDAGTDPATSMIVDPVNRTAQITFEALANHPRIRDAFDPNHEDYGNFCIFVGTRLLGNHNVRLRIDRLTLAMTSDVAPPWASDAIIAQFALESADYTHVIVSEGTQAAIVNAALAAVRSQVEAIAPASATIGVISFTTALPQVPAQGLPQANYSFNVAIAGQDGSSATAVINVPITFLGGLGGGVLQSIRVDAGASRTSYYINETIDPADIVVYADFGTGTEVRVTDFQALVVYSMSETTINGITASELGLYRTGPREVLITYASYGVSETYSFTINVGGHRVYREIEFDLASLLGSDVITPAQRWGTQGRHWPAGQVFTMLNELYDGTEFDIEWLQDPAVVLTAEFVSAAEITPGAGHDGVPQVRLGFIRDPDPVGSGLGFGTVGGVQVPRNAAYWNQRTSGPPVSMNERHYGSVDIRHRSLPTDNGIALAVVNPAAGGGSYGTMQAVTEDFLRRAAARNHFPDGWHYLIVFGGGVMVGNPDSYLTRVTIGMLEDRPAPWEVTDWSPGVPTSVVVTAPSNTVPTGGTMQFAAEVIGTNNPLQYVTWSVIGAAQVATAITPQGLLSVHGSETALSFTVRATSILDSAIYGEFTVIIEIEGTGDPISVFDPLRFNYSNIPTYFPNRYGTVEANLLHREDAHTLPRQSMAFYSGWLQPGTVLTVGYNLTGTLTDAFVQENIQFGIRRRSETSQEFIHGLNPQWQAAAGPAEPGMHGAGAGRAWANLPVSTNPSLSATHVILDPVARTAQVTFEALYHGLGANDRYLLANGQFFTPSVRFAGVNPGGGTINWGGQTGTVTGMTMTIGYTNPTGAPWRTPITLTRISDNMPNPGPLPAGLNDPSQSDGRSLSYHFPGDLGMGSHSSIVRWDDFSETAVGRITNVGQLNQGRHRWDNVRLQAGSPGSEVNMYIVARGDEYTPSVVSGTQTDVPRAGNNTPISGAADPRMPGDQAVVFWTNSEGPQHFGIELQQQFVEEAEYMINDAGVVFVRLYQYWAPNYAINTSSHNGITFSALDRHRMADGAHGANDFLIPIGYDWYNIIYEFVRSTPGLYIPPNTHGSGPTPIRSPGRAAMYVYYSWQASMTNRPTNHIWGDLFFPDGYRAGQSPYGNFGAPWASHPNNVGTAPHRNPTRGGISPQSYGFWEPMPNFWPENAIWHSMELMVKPNTVVYEYCPIAGEEVLTVQRDGRITGWVDGEVIIDFPNMVFRYTEDLMLNVSRVLLINQPNNLVDDRATYRMITQYYMSTRYIGPMHGNRHAIRVESDLSDLELYVTTADLSDAAVLIAAISALDAIEAAKDLLPADATLPGIAAPLPILQARIDALRALLDTYLYDTYAGQAALALENASFGPYEIDGSPVTAVAVENARLHMLTVVGDLLDEYHPLVSVMSVVFNNPPTNVPSEGLPQADYEFTANLIDSDGIPAVANITAAIIFSPEADTDARNARLALEAHNFDDITAEWLGGNAPARLQAVIANIEAQIAGLLLANVTIEEVSWVLAPTIAPIGVPLANYQFIVYITGDDGSESRAQITVPVAFAPRPFDHVPRYNEIFFATTSTPAAGAFPSPVFGTDFSNIGFNPPQFGGTAATMQDGRTFQADWFAPGVVFTQTFETLVAHPTYGWSQPVTVCPSTLPQHLFNHFNMGKAVGAGQVMIRNQYHSASGATMWNRSWLDRVNGMSQLTYGAFWSGPVNAGVQRDSIATGTPWQLSVMQGMAGTFQEIRFVVTGASLAMYDPNAIPPWGIVDDTPAINAAISIIEAADLDDLTYAQAPNEAAAATHLEGVLQALQGMAELNVDIAITAYGAGFIASVPGTASNPTGTPGSFTFVATVTRGTGTPADTVPITVGIIPEVYAGMADIHIAAAIAAIQAANFADVAQADVDTTAEAIAHINAVIAAITTIHDDIVVTVNITTGGFVAAVAGTESDPAGTDGSVTFTVTAAMSPGTPQTTELSFNIIATEWTPLVTAIPRYYEIHFSNTSGPQGARSFPIVMNPGDFGAIRVFGYPRGTPAHLPGEAFGQMEDGRIFYRDWFRPGVVFNIYFETLRPPGHPDAGQVFDPTTLPASTFTNLTAGLYMTPGSIAVRNQIHSAGGATPLNRVWMDLENGVIQMTFDTVFGADRAPSSNAGQINAAIEGADYALAILLGAVAQHGLHDNARINVTGMSLAVHETDMAAPWAIAAPEALPAPTGLVITSTILSWDAVANATGYRVYVDGAAVTGTITATSFDLDTLNLADGSYAVTVRAIGDEVAYLDSPLSESVIFVVQTAPLPVFGWHIFNNGPGGTQYPRPNAGLAAAGTTRMWTQLDGVNAPVYFDAADTIVALDQDENCAMEFVTVSRMWVAGTGWADYFNMVNVNKNGQWQYINLSITVFGETVHVLLANALFVPPVLPVFGWNIFNNGPGGTQYPRPNPSLAANGTIRMWTQLDGANSPVYFDAADTIVALDQNSECAMEFVTVNRMWVAGQGWANYFNMVNVNKNGDWQYILLSITVYGETVHALLVNALFEATPVVPRIISVTPNPAAVEQGGTVELVVTTQGMPDGAWVDLNVAWRPGLSIVGGSRFYIVDGQAIITVAAAENAPLGRDGFSVAARTSGDWGSVVLIGSYAIVIEVV